MAVPVAVRVTAPATSANLGPAFDSAGLALALHDEVVARVTGGGLQVRVTGQGERELPRDGRHLVVTAMRATFDRLGWQPAGLSVTCRNAIPQSRGLGSSSAAIVAAVLAARALVPDGEQRLDAAAVLGLATELEGHPDNVAACLLGGFTLAWTGSGGVRVHRTPTHPDLAPVALVPPTRSSTRAVRGLLPPTVAHAEAAANSARSALLALALTVEPALLLEATEDRLHQRFRAPAMPGTADLVARLRQEGVAAVVSGAGPTVLALCTRGRQAAVLAGTPAGWLGRDLGVAVGGAVVERLE